MELAWLLSPPQAGVSCPTGDLGQERGLGQSVCQGWGGGYGTFSVGLRFSPAKPILIQLGPTRGLSPTAAGLGASAKGHPEQLDPGAIALHPAAAKAYGGGSKCSAASTLGLHLSHPWGLLPATVPSTPPKPLGRLPLGS